MAFSGFYYKINAPENQLRFIIVVGYQKIKNKTQGFIQFNCVGQFGETRFSRYFTFEETSYINGVLSMGKNSFSHSFIRFNEKDLQISIGFESKVTLPQKRFAKNVMGIYGYIPFVECKHHVHAIEAGAKGSIDVGSTNYSLKSEKTYIERTYGKNFPDTFFWSHFNNFDGHNDTHLLFSIANPQWLFLKKRVHIGYLLHKNNFYPLGINQDFKLINPYKNKDLVQFEFVKRELSIRTEFKFGESSIQLIGPTKHGLNRGVKEYTNASVDISIYQNQNCIEKIRGNHGTIENEESISYIK